MKIVGQWIAICVFAFAATSQAAAEVRLAAVFANHPVLQRDRPISIWGSGEQGEKVKVEFAGQVAETTVNNDGDWSVTLKPLAATATGRSLQIEGSPRPIVIHDIVVGEVWHASGQSNMAMTVADMSRQLETVKDDVIAADLPAIRFCRVNAAESATPLRELSQLATWIACKPETVSGFSGVAFYFARELHREIGIPIGVIDTSRGGTPIEPFIPREAFDGHPTLRRELELGDRHDLDGLWKLPGGVRARDSNWLPGRLFHSRLTPLTRFAARGVIWYQGESNSGDREDPRDYQHKMQALISGWRNAFANERLPVYFVQLPGSGAGAGWPYLREQQRLAAATLLTGMAVTIDIEGGDIHPPNKVDVGQRLARWALARDYGKQVAVSGPLFEKQEIRGNKIVVHFQHTDSGLLVATKAGLASPRATPDAELANFEVLDNAGIWQSAVAKIEGKTVVVSSPKVPEPISVRYAYSATPVGCNLYNGDGLPASPFCSKPELLVYNPGIPE